MVFSSMVFIFLFLPVVVLLYYLIPGRAWRNTLLCAASLFFYAWGEPVYILLMLGSTMLNYAAGMLLQYPGCRKWSRGILAVSVILNLSLLFFFKYTDFFIDNINILMGSDIGKLNLPLPIGISFYTFQAVSYIVDVYRGRIKPQKNPVYLAMYIAFFPQLIAGPIVRYSDIENEIDGRKETLDGFVEGLGLFIKGLASKVILANNLASFADSVYSDLSDAGSLILWLAALCYMLQIYFDFAGYSTMAIGLGRMFGFNFPRNFNKPYTADSVTDFWRRWHITLSTWFRDYVYIPLGGNRCSVPRHIFNITVTWLLTGFWHGAAWNFMLWGLYYAFFLLMEKYLFIRFLKGRKAAAFAYRLLTLVIVLVGWVLFRVEGLAELGNVLRGMFSFTHTDLAVYVLGHAAVFSKLFYLIPGLLAAGNLPGIVWKVIRKRIPDGAAVFLRNIVLAGLLAVSTAFLLASSYNPFIYFRF